MIQSINPTDGIAGLHGKDPHGAVVTIGHKGPKGNPIDTDRFFIVVTQEVDGVRREHPSFASFNGAAHPSLLMERLNNGDPNPNYNPSKHAYELASRQRIRGNLVHSEVADCFEMSLKAQVLNGIPSHPAKAPACMGNGRQAQRWNGKAYVDIPCPNEACEFRQRVGDKPTPCKPWMRFSFRISWPEKSTLPAMLVKFTSGSWNNASAFKGFFDYIANQAAALGLTHYSLYGLPFEMTLTKKKRSGDAGGRAFPIITITPTQDIVSFLAAQQVQLRELGAPPRRYISLRDPEEQRPEVIEADRRAIVPTRLSNIPTDPGGE
jgi:hypothetical protein